MTRLLIAYDGSPSARTAIAAAGALFEHAEAVVAHVHPPTPSLEAERARPRRAAGRRDPRGDRADARRRADARAQRRSNEGVELARAAGLEARGGAALRGHAVARAAGRRRRDRRRRDRLRDPRRRSDRPGRDRQHGLEPAAPRRPRGYSSSPRASPTSPAPCSPASTGQTVRAPRCASPPTTCVRGRSSSPTPGAPPPRDSARSRATRSRSTLAWSSVAMPRWPKTVPRSPARPVSRRRAPTLPMSGQGTWQTLLAAGQEQGAAAILIGSRGRGALASTVLGSVASGLVHAAEMPVLVGSRE